MRRFLGFLPFALITAGCGIRPWTPSVSVAFWSQDVPPPRDVQVPRSTDVANAWALPHENPWSPYVKNTMFSSVDQMSSTAALPDVRTLEVAAMAQDAAAHVAAVGMPENTLWVVDLRGAASCAFVSTLTRTAKAPVSPVVTFNNWPAEDELLPADETLAGLLAFSPQLPPAELAGAASTPVFVLDSWRLAYRFDEPDEGTYDNRYALTQGDFPDAATLKARGITRVVYVVEDLDDAEVEEDDLHASFLSWQMAGLQISMVDLGFLRDIPAPPAGQEVAWFGREWDDRLRGETYVVKERYTILDEPHFYVRARAGFGWSTSRPVIIHGYGGGYSHSGGG